jgi:hypothetical protein
VVDLKEIFVRMRDELWGLKCLNFEAQVVKADVPRSAPRVVVTLMQLLI